MPSTAASGRRSRIHANASGTSVKTSRRTTQNRSRQSMKPGLRRTRRPSRSTSRTQSSTSGSKSARVELEHVVRRAGEDVAHDADARAALVEHVQPDEVGDVVRCRSGSGGRASRAHGELGAALDGRSSLIARRRPPTCRETTTRAGSPSTSSSRADLEPPRILARLLDDERAVDPVRAPDAADANELVLGLSRQSRARSARRPGRRPRGRCSAARARSAPACRSPCRRRRARRGGGRRSRPHAPPSRRARRPARRRAVARATREARPRLRQPAECRRP